eukprot:5099036-Amphidinium_carterae.1
MTGRSFKDTEASRRKEVETLTCSIERRALVALASGNITMMQIDVLTKLKHIMICTAKQTETAWPMQRPATRQASKARAISLAHTLEMWHLMRCPGNTMKH